MEFGHGGATIIAPSGEQADTTTPKRNESYNCHRVLVYHRPHALRLLCLICIPSLTMSLQRAVTPLTSSSYLIYKFASAPTSRPCQHVLRKFATSQSARMSSKRKMQTSSAYHPYSLSPVPPPPRNVGVPDTSIAGAIPQINDTRPPKMTGQHDIPECEASQEACSISVTEQEAQKSKPTAAAAPQTPAPNTSTQPKARPRTKLRARKAAMNLTASAVSQLRAMLDQPDPKLIKVGVKNRGCSGLAYHLEYVEKPGTFDEMVEQDGVKVLIDSKALFSIIGSEMDWVEDKLNQRFVFKNPNISMYPSPLVVYCSC